MRIIDYLVFVFSKDVVAIFVEEQPRWQEKPGFKAEEENVVGRRSGSD